jgi:nucleoside-diphosphate-sugar epimerase
VERGDDVVVVDGLLPETGGSLTHLAGVEDAIEMRTTTIETTGDLETLVAGAAVIVDCMAWTRHLAAFEDPLYDLRLNLESHLRVLAYLRKHRSPMVIYVGSRSQYGRVTEGPITEETPMLPQDVQGVHKSAADHHFRIHAERYGLNVINLRLPNCFGEQQPTSGADIGLVGGFIRTLLYGGSVKVFGAGRRRALLYARDAADIVSKVSDAAPAGFVAVNVAADAIEIRDLATMLASLVGSGSVVTDEMPRELQLMDAGEATVADDRLRQMIGETARTELASALKATVAYFKDHAA